MAILKMCAWDSREQIQVVVRRADMNSGPPDVKSRAQSNQLAMLPLLGFPHLFQWIVKIAAVGGLQEQSPIINLYLLIKVFLSFC